jgi:hypothetical protein
MGFRRCPRRIHHGNARKLARMPLGKFLQLGFERRILSACIALQSLRHSSTSGFMYGLAL